MRRVDVPSRHRPVASFPPPYLFFMPLQGAPDSVIVVPFAPTAITICASDVSGDLSTRCGPCLKIAADRSFRTPHIVRSNDDGVVVVQKVMSV